MPEAATSGVELEKYGMVYFVSKQGNYTTFRPPFQDVGRRAFALSKKYAIYLRKSRADVEAEQRGEGETLARHRRALTDLANKRGLNVVATYEEIVTGDTISSRPQMQQLLSAVERGEYAGVIVNDADRLARGDSIDQGVVKQAFYSTGTLIITPIKTYDPSNVADEDFFDFSLFMARFEYKMIKRRLQTGRMRSASEGNYLGSRTVFGYRRVKRPDRPGWTLEIHPENAEIVRMIFNLYAYGEGGVSMGADSIARKLNEMGLTTDLGHKYDGGRIRSILKNPAYIGQVSWGKRLKRVNISGGVRTTTREINPDPIISENAHPAIIDMDLWNTVQDMFARHCKRPKHTLAPVSNVLSGLVYCSICGKAMQRKPGVQGRPDLLHCKTYGCPTTGIYIPVIEDALIEALEDWNAQYSSPAVPSCSTETSDAPIRAIQRQIATLNKQLDALHDLVEQGIYTPVVFVQRRDDLKARIAQAESQLRAVESTPTPADLIRSHLPQIRYVLEAYPFTDDLQLKNELLHSVISKVVYSKTKRCFRNENPADFLELTIYPAGNKMV